MTLRGYHISFATALGLSVLAVYNIVARNAWWIVVGDIALVLLNGWAAFISVRFNKEADHAAD